MPRSALVESLSVAEAAKLVGGEVHGSPDAVISGVCSLDEQREGSIAFYDKRKKDEVIAVAESFSGSCLIIRSTVDRSKLRKDLSYICCEHPLVAVSMLAWKLHPFWERKSGISEKASVHPSVSIGERVTICEFASVAEDCVIEDDVCIYPGAVIYPGCTLGSGTIIHAGAVIREETKLGAEVIIQSGAVIGGDGFGYYPGPEGLEPVPQVGNVVLADRVDIGSNACVDRATFGSTRIGSRTKIDNLVQVGHNTKIGMNSIVCGLSGISGSCKIGNGVTLAGGVGVADQVSIEDGAVFAARSGLGTVKHYATGVYSGFPAMSASRWRRREVLISRLPELFSSKKDAEQGGASERRRSFGK